MSAVPRSFDHLLGREVTFDHGGRRTRGKVVQVFHAPNLQPGDVPDAHVTIRGASGAHVETTLVAGWVQLADG